MLDFKKISVFGVLFAGLSVWGAGFGLYEMDAKSTGMGGHVVGTPFNASAVYYNPAGMSCLTGTCINVNCVMLYPPIPYRVWGGGYRETDGRIDPGAFVFPTIFVTQELPWGLHLGLGFYADFGLGSQYDDNWDLKYDSVRSDFEGYTFNPAISWKIPGVEGLSVAGGIRFTFVNFETESVRDFNLAKYGIADGNYGLNRLNLAADNARGLGIGWNAGVRYELTDDVSLGLMYRSTLRTKIQGEATWNGPATMGEHHNDLEDAMTLPQQVTLGFNWKNFCVKDLQLGMSASYIGWSVMEHYVFDVYNPLYRTTDRQSLDLNWRDTIRIGFGLDYEITDNWEALIGYNFDKDPSSDSEGNAHTMLPPGDRHVIAFGVAWHTADRRWELAFTYAPIIMQHSCAAFRDEWSGRRRYMDTTASCTHCACVGVTYRF